MGEDTALRLDDETNELRNRLESMFTSLTTIHSVLIVSSAALKAQASDYDREVASVLIRCGADPLHGELESLGATIEGLGGKAANPE